MVYYYTSTSEGERLTSGCWSGLGLHTHTLLMAVYVAIDAGLGGRMPPHIHWFSEYEFFVLLSDLEYGGAAQYR